MSHAEYEAENDSRLDDDSGDETESREIGEEDNEVSAAHVERVRRPRAQRAPAHVEIGPFGAVPVNAKAWGMMRARPGGDWEALKHGDQEGTLNEEWPIESGVPTVALVRERWGAGTFRASWWTATPRGGKKFVCHGRTVTLEAAERAPAAPAGVVGSPSVSAFEEGLRFMKLVKEHAAGSMSEAMQLAQFFASVNQRSNGISGEELRAILRDEREAQALATQAAIEAAVEPLERRLAEFSDDDDDDSPVADAARAAGPALFSGRKWWQQLGQFATQNPKVVEAALPVVVGAVQNIANVVATAVAPPPPQQRPRAQLVPQPLPPQQYTPPRAVAAAPAPVPAPVPAAVPAAVPVPVDDRNDPPVVAPPAVATAAAG